jgi:hypothetical protein
LKVGDFIVSWFKLAMDSRNPENGQIPIADVSKSKSGILLALALSNKMKMYLYLKKKKKINCKHNYVPEEQ